MSSVPPDQQATGTPAGGSPEGSPLPGSGKYAPQDTAPPFGAPPAFGESQQTFDAQSPYGVPPPFGAPPAGAPVYDAPAYGAPSYDAQQYGAQQYGTPQYGVAPYPGGAAPWMGPQCPACGQPFGQGSACQACGQVGNMAVGYRVASAGERFGQYLLEGVLIIFTLVIGWLIWSLVIWGRGQTPAMQILKMRCVKKDTGQVATWGTMALRELVGKLLVMWVIGALFFPAALVLDFMLLWDKDRQELWDKIAGTIVVDDPVAP